jgi:hypothetical protein
MPGNAFIKNLSKNTFPLPSSDRNFQLIPLHRQSLICIDRYNFYLIKYVESGIILSGTNLNAYPEACLHLRF